MLLKLLGANVLAGTCKTDLFVTCVTLASVVVVIRGSLESIGILINTLPALANVGNVSPPFKVIVSSDPDNNAVPCPANILLSNVIIASSAALLAATSGKRLSNTNSSSIPKNPTGRVILRAPVPNLSSP